MPRLLHLPTQPGLRLRVAPYLAPFLLNRRPNPQVAPWLRAFGCAGDGPRRLPRASHAFGVAGFSEVPGFPGGSHLLLQRPRCRTWVAPRPASPALPAMDRRVAPTARIFRRCRLANPQVSPSPGLSVSPTIRCPGCPEPRILRHRLMDIRVTSDHAPSGLPWSNLQVAPDILPWLRQLTNFQVALNLGSLAVRRFPTFRVAPNLGSSADPYLLPRVAPFLHLRLSR